MSSSGSRRGTHPLVTDVAGDAARGGGTFPFTTIIVTNPDEASAAAAQKLLDSTLRRHLKAAYPSQRDEVRIVSTCDPFGARCGSGGGTLAALELLLLPLLPVRPPRNDADGDENGKPQETVLCLHAGGDSSRCPLSMVLGKAWTSLPSSKYRNPMMWLVHQLEELFRRSRVPRGSLVVAATDCLMSFGQGDGPEGEAMADLSGDEADPWTVLGVAVPAPVTTAKNHGVYVLPESILAAASPSPPRLAVVSPVDVWQKPTVDQLLCGPAGDLSSPPSLPPASFDMAGRSGKQAWIDVGVVIFYPKAFETLLQLLEGPLAGCTRTGLEAAYNEATRSSPSSAAASLEAYAKQNALKIDLYTDILHNIPLSRPVVPMEDTHESSDAAVGGAARSPLERALSKLLLKVLVAPEGSFLHLGTTQELVEFITLGANAPYSSESSAVSNNVTIDLGATKSLVEALNMKPRFLAWTGDGQEQQQQRTSHLCSNVALCSTFPGSRNDNDGDDLKSGTTIGKRSLVEYCDLEDFASVSVGDDCMLSGWRNLGKGTCMNVESLSIPDSLSIQLLPIQHHASIVTDEGGDSRERFVYMVLGTNDGTKTPFPGGTVYGIPVPDFLERTGITVADLGFEGGVFKENDCLWSAEIHPIVSEDEPSMPYASLFEWVEQARLGTISLDVNSSLKRWIAAPRVSLKDLHAISDAAKEWAYRLSLDDKASQLQRDRSVSRISRLLRTRCQDEPCELQWLMELHDSEEAFEALCLLIDSLEKIACEELEDGNYDICGRAFMLASATLADFDAVGRGDRFEWGDFESVMKNCRELIGKLKLSSTKTMAKSERLQMIKQILHLQRTFLDKRGTRSFLLCSETMELLALAMIEFAIADSFRRFLDPKFPDSIHFGRTSKPIYDMWILTTAPVRVDLAGGWSDTPPICYEYGGAVTGMAVLVDNQYPLCCRGRVRSGGTGILLKTEIRDVSTGDLVSCNRVKIEDIQHLNDFRDPSASCALVKASLICLGLATEEQLQAKDALQPLINKFCSTIKDVSIELVSTSLLGMGTGMGTSSILGACIIQTIAECVGIGRMQNQCLLQTVLMLEQLLSSGGGWQDQALGILAGVKTIRSQPPRIPLDIQIEELILPEKAVAAFEERLLFAFTGKTRLAKNILQQVLRRWSRRTTEIVSTVRGLVNAAEKTRGAILDESWDRVGDCLYEAFKLKCVMAGEDSGAEPPLVKLFVAELVAHAVIRGAMLCGAGGGGFLLLLLSEGVDKKQVESFFESEVLPLDEDFKEFSFHSCRIAEIGLTTSVMDDESIDSDSYDISWQRQIARPLPARHLKNGDSNFILHMKESS